MRRKAILRELAVFAFFVALTVALTWPLAANLRSGVNDLGDPLLTAWILDWVDYAILHQPSQLFQPPIFYPGILPLAYSENLIAVAVLMLPLHLAGVAPLTIHNVAFLLGFALSGYAAFVLARMATRNTLGSLIGGVFYAFCCFKFDHIAHLQIIFSPWVPLLLAALLAFWEKPQWGRGVLLTLVWVANGLTNIYFLLFLSVAVTFTVPLLAVIRPRGWRFYLGLGASTLAAVLLLMPFLTPYRNVSKHYHVVREAAEVQRGAATWKNWLVPTASNRMYGRIPAGTQFEPERQLFPGLLILLLSGAGWLLWRDPLPLETEAGSPLEPLPPSPRTRRILRLVDGAFVVTLVIAWAAIVSDRVAIKIFGAQLFAADSSDIPLLVALALVLIRFAIRLPRALGGIPLREAAARSRFGPLAWVAAVWIVVGMAGSFGLSNVLYGFFYRRIEAFQAMRVPARFAIITYTGLAVWGALGAAAIVNARRGLKRLVAGGVLLALMIADVRPRIRWEQAPTHTPAVYSWLAKTKVGPVLELPFSGEGVDYLYLLGSMVHRVPIVNGTSGFFPAEYWEMRDPDSRDDFDPMLALAEKWGVRLVVVHGPLLKARRANTVYFLRRQLYTHRLEFLGNFENELEGDYVFAVTRNLPNWRKFAAPEVPDGGGFLPRQTLERFFAGQSTHTDAVLVNMDFPLPMMTIQGPLRVSGWTLSPHGVQKATLLMHAGTKRFEMKLIERPDVLAAYPWMRYFNDRPGFELVLNERPRGIPMDTSVQVEIEDRAGRVRRGRDTLIR
ncbi:MAG: hypothetical protein ABI779_21665, partial [Acidobacteriota bacterium]